MAGRCRIQLRHSGTTYTASFKTQYLLTMSAGGGGRWSGQQLLRRQPECVDQCDCERGYSFTGWTQRFGVYSGGSNPANVGLNGPITETAASPRPRR